MMKFVFLCSGAAGTLLFMLLVLAKHVLLGLGPRYDKIADKLPRTKICWGGLIVFIALLCIPQLFF